MTKPVKPHLYYPSWYVGVVCEEGLRVITQQKKEVSCDLAHQSSNLNKDKDRLVDVYEYWWVIDYCVLALSGACLYH